MLWRAAWLVPVGLTVVVLLDGILNVLSKKIDNFQIIPGRKATFALILITCLLLTGYYSTNVYSTRWLALTRLPQYRNKLLSLSNLGIYLEENIKQPSRFVAPQPIMDYLPGLSSKAKPVFFRSNIYTPNPPNMNKVKLILSGDQQTSLEERVDVFLKYDIRYMVVQDEAIKNYYSNYPEFFDIQIVGNFWLIEFLENRPEL
jgi:hypothetical protein